MSTLEIFHLIWHILLAVLSAIATGCLISRYIQLKMTGKRSELLFWWSIGLILMSILAFWLILWDFPNLFRVDQALVAFTQTAVKWYLIPLGLFCFALPAFRQTIKTNLFWPFTLVFIVMMFSIALLISLALQNPQIFAKVDPLSIYSFGFLAPAQLFIAFLFLFLFLTSIGPHFWKVRGAGFLMIVFAFFILTVMNTAHCFMTEAAGSWESIQSASLFSLTSVMQFSREIGYLILIIGFWLATMPRVIRRYDHTKLVEMDHEKVVEAKPE